VPIGFGRLGAEPQHAAPEGADREVVRLSNGEFSCSSCARGGQSHSDARSASGLSRLHGDDVYNRSVNTQILRLRRKLESDPAKPCYICTERGRGMCSTHGSTSSTERRPAELLLRM